MSEHPGLDLETLENLLRLLREHGVGEFEYKHGELSIRISQAISHAETHDSSTANPSSVHPGSLPSSLLSLFEEIVSQASRTRTGALPSQSESPDDLAVKASELVPPPAPSKEEEDIHVIESPIVGTFYRSPSPDEAPFVEIGDIVHEGQTVCIVEAMKIMNEIQADVAGEIVAIYAANGAPIEFGQKLMAIRSIKPQ